jgi:cell wall-associated NlpC family hydrolase
MTRRIQLALISVVILAACGLVRTGLALGAHARHVGIQTRTLLSNTARMTSLVQFARRFVGVPYVYGGGSPSTGFDCSGFTRFVYGRFGIVLPHQASQQFAMGQSVPLGSLQPGDLVFFDGLGHVGLYLGGNLFIHAPHTGARVEIDSLSGWYLATYDGARRLAA